MFGCVIGMLLYLIKYSRPDTGLKCMASMTVFSETHQFIKHILDKKSGIEDCTK